jgi:peptidoglycan/xylan/chitin deacetylase (PgdA/CDA1 family)
MNKILFILFCFLIVFVFGPFFCRYLCPFYSVRELLANLQQAWRNKQFRAVPCKDADCRQRKKAQAALGLICIFSFSWFFVPQFGGLTIATLSQGAEARLIPIYSVDTQGEKLVALTFDAAWGATRTLSILDILDQNEVKATFFLTNIWMKEYPDMVKAIAQRGHELALHSDSHPNLTKISAGQLELEIENNRQLLRELTGIEGKAFRPPFGAYDNRLIAVLMNKGLYPVQWSADSLDWKEISAQDMLVKLQKEISPGGIVLFHNDGLHTPEALPSLIEYLIDQGYRFATIKDLVYSEPWVVDQQGVQRKLAGK